MNTDVHEHAGDGGLNGEGLRGRAERAWAAQQRHEDEGAPERAVTEERLLLAKLVELGGAAQTIKVTRAGARVVAEAEGLRFISTYNDPTLRKLGWDDEPELHGVVLLKRCPKCGQDQKSGIIRTPAELGRELRRLPVIPVHLCAGGGGPGAAP